MRLHVVFASFAAGMGLATPAQAERSRPSSRGRRHQQRCSQVATLDGK
jgi:hypothetical protein